MPHCAFLSISNTEGWFIDDDLVHPELQALGWQIDNIPWNLPTDWNQYELVVIRSPWDYQDHLDEFLAVLKQIEASSAILCNPLSLVEWNINKKYLFELESKGVELVPTKRVNTPNEASFLSAFEHFEVDELIVKPMIGANADDTFRISKAANGDFKQFIECFKHRECMIQPFMQSIVEEGEFSLMYFNGKLSHTILKTVAKGDYRVQEEHGGGVVRIEKPESELLLAAEKAMNALPEKPLFARVDLVRTPKNSFALMELELIEPCLYFRFDAASPKNFAQLINDSYTAIEK